VLLGTSVQAFEKNSLIADFIFFNCFKSTCGHRDLKMVQCMSCILCEGLAGTGSCGLVPGALCNAVGGVLV